MEAQAAEKARMEQEAAAKRQQEEEQRRREAEEKSKREAEALLRSSNEAKVTAAPKARLTNYFDAIAGSGNTSAANSSIQEALTLFSSPDAPVLIVISQENGEKDYDKPTNIKDYLNYLKDQKKNSNLISDLKFDGAGKITELELVKAPR